ncbi:class I SAM-dependent methyltransferase [Rhodoferax sp.]|uniref:SAM-dependent methyltransferase n=1 Tax=Rhodoferax sp. TaxID=50421 RepID=UPI001EBD0FAF|nr:class I SAM-dependent methyltransferase [Rhodoferax sp.]MBT9507566.1 class I SAM-dependent methyltransferase [Rhodoferax sp.]
MTSNKSIAFFDEQFKRQLSDDANKLNPFEDLALPYLRGEVLDFGCGLGNLAFAAALRGCQVRAIDASPAAIEHIKLRAAADNLQISASVADLRDYSITGDYDCIVCIGLLMFFDCTSAFKVLSQLQSHVRPGGLVIINVLVEGTTYMDMFDPSSHCLFEPFEMLRRFKGWDIEHSEFTDFEAPQATLKRFSTVIARRPGI